MALGAAMRRSGGNANHDRLGARSRFLLRTTFLSGALTAGIAVAESPPSSDGGTGTLEFGVPKAPFLSPHQIIKLMEASPTAYDVQTGGCPDIQVSDYAKAIWPAAGVHDIETPVWVTEKDGAIDVREYQHKAEAIPFLNKGEVEFAAEKYDEAIGYYRKALEAAPNDYLALLYLGDSAYRQGFLSDALEMYLRAGVADPADTRSYFFRASVYSLTDEVELAVDAYAEALVRAPRRATLLKAIGLRAKRLGISEPRDFFNPKAMAQQSGGKIRVCVAPDGLQWLGFGLCKAMWLGEASHREAMTGTSKHHFSNIEEKECLVALLEGYKSLRQAGKTSEDKELERLQTIVKAGMTDDFILFELATRVLPQAPLYATDGMRRKLKAYILRFVLEREASPADAGTH
jgi:tetratricopeptide (TPR) repeat protein